MSSETESLLQQIGIIVHFPNHYKDKLYEVEYMYCHIKLWKNKSIDTMLLLSICKCNSYIHLNYKRIFNLLAKRCLAVSKVFCDFVAFNSIPNIVKRNDYFQVKISIYLLIFDERYCCLQHFSQFFHLFSSFSHSS